MDVKVKSLLGEHPSLSLLGNGKVHCSLTNHECPARVESIEQYVNGAKYKKARDWYSHDFSQYEPYLVTSRHNPKRLYCMVTRREVNKIPHEVDVHINSGRYKIALEKFEKKRQKALRIEQGLPVTDSEDSDLETWEEEGELDMEGDEMEPIRKKKAADLDGGEEGEEEIDESEDSEDSEDVAEEVEEILPPKRKMRKL